MSREKIGQKRAVFALACRAELMRLCFALALGCAIWPIAANAGAEAPDSFRARGWKSVGPAPPAILAPIVAHPPSGTIYIGSLGGGVFKSTNGGSRFVPLDNSPRSATSLTMNPDDPNVVYAGFSKTTDGGATWTDMEGGGSAALVMDPTDPNVLYGVSGDVLKTVDGGATWFPVEGISEIGSLAINPSNPSEVYAGTVGGVFRSTDGAISWILTDVDATVLALLVDPSNGSIVYAGSNGNGVYKSIDGGASFARIGSPQANVVFSLAKGGDKLYAGTNENGVSVSKDGGVTWKNTGVAEGRGYALSTDSAGALYLGTNFEGAFVLPAGDRHDRDGERDEDFDDDRGDRNHKWRRLGWKQLEDCACQEGYAVAVDPSDRKHVLFTANLGGLFVTRDGGRTWKDGGLHGLTALSPSGVAFDPQQPRRVYVGSFGEGVFKSEDHGKHWVRRQVGTGAIIVGLDVDPIDHSVYVATVFGGIWKSTDFGDTFTRIDRAPGAPPGEFLDLSGRGITVDPRNHSTVYFADRGTGIWRSPDAGASWTNVDGEPAQNVTVDPTDSNIVYSGSLFAGVLKSTDGGASFTVKSNGLPDGVHMPPAGGVRVNPAHPNVLYVGAEGDGVFKSTDGAETWMTVDLGLDGSIVLGLAIDPIRPNILYAATSSSVYKTRTGGE
jgi:photosystem II stability/assembly factor-like uncharacterized protein